jgi:hypothetical protein
VISGSRGPYIDPMLAYDLIEVVGRMPMQDDDASPKNEADLFHQKRNELRCKHRSIVSDVLPPAVVLMGALEQASDHSAQNTTGPWTS